MNYCYEIFQREIMKRGINNNNMNGGFGSGIISQQDFENGQYGFVWVDMSRKIDEADYLTGKNIEINARNSSKCPVDVILFLFYETEWNVDVTTSLLTI